MLKTNEAYRVLVFNQCESRLRHLARTGHSFHLAPPQHHPQQSWRGAFWPLPENVVEIDRAAAVDAAQAGAYDLVLCQDIEELASAWSWGLPRLFAPLGMLESAAEFSPAVRRAVLAQLQPMLDGVEIVFQSEKQRRSWGLEGEVAGWGIDPEEYGDPAGDRAAVLHFRTGAPDHLSGFPIHEALLGGDLPAAVAELESGALDWAGVVELLRGHRVLFSALPEGHADGCDAYVLAAMAAGVPVVCTANSSSPVVDGYNGYISNDFDYLRDKLRTLLAEPETAAELGRNARQTVRERFPLEEHLARWNEAFARCAGRGAGEPAGTSPRVSIAIPVHNKAELTEACLFALAENTGDETAYEVIVVDNASSDWTQYLLHAFEGDLRVLSNDENEGFGRANNQAAAAAEGEYLLFLNNDTAPRQGWLDALVRLADSDPSIGIVGAKLLFPDTGEVQHAGIEYVDGRPHHAHLGTHGDDPRVNEVRDLDMVTGACMLVRRSLFEELGGFDEGYVNGVEDVDLCLRARERGWRVVYCPASVVEHHEAVTEGRYDKVNENFIRFAERWQRRFGADGRLVVADAGAAAQQPFRGHWEGPFLVHSSLGKVNRELVLALLEGGRCELGLSSTQPTEFTEPRFNPVAERLGQTLDEPVDFHLRHCWPPDFSRPDAGKLILVQPWEFGRIPKEWVEPIRENVDQIWAYTKYVRDCYVGSGIDAESVEIVRLGVDVERFRPGLEGLDLATEKTFKFLFVGGTLERKGIDCLLEAYRRGFAPEDDVCLVIKDSGIDSYYKGQTAGDRIRELQTDPRCAEILYLTEDMAEADIPRLYAACDSLVHPYRGEGFGLPVAEAMACGLPVVVTRGGACDDFCRDDAVYFVDSRRLPVRFPDGYEAAGTPWALEPNMNHLVAQMQEICADPEAARGRGAVAAAHIADNFTWQHAAQDALAALAKLRGDVEIVAAPPVAPVIDPPQVAPVVPVIDPPPAAPTAAADGALIVLGAADEDTATAVVAALGGAVDRRDLEVDADASLGQTLVEMLPGVRGEFVVVLGPGCAVDEAGVRQLVDHLRQQEDIALILPGRPGAGRGVGLEEVDIPEDGLLVFRRQALELVGGFNQAFRSAAVLAEAGRQIGRLGGRAVRVLECAVEGEYQPVGEGYANELAAVAALAEGDQMRALGDDETALEAYRRSVAAKGDFVEPIVVLAATLMELGQPAEAVEYLERLVQLDGESFQAHNYLGLALYQAGQVDAARAKLRQASELNPTYVETLVNLAVLEWEQERPEEAIDYLERAGELEPDNRDVIVNTGIMQAQMGNVEAGVNLLQSYVELNVRDGDAASSLADILIQNGDLDAARDLAGRLLAHDPQYPVAQAILERIRGQENQGQA